MYDAPKIYLLIYEHPSGTAGLVQPQDKIVDRCALTIYPYSLGIFRRDAFNHLNTENVSQRYK